MRSRKRILTALLMIGILAAVFAATAAVTSTIRTDSSINTDAEDASNEDASKEDAPKEDASRGRSVPDLSQEEVQAVEQAEEQKEELAKKQEEEQETDLRQQVIFGDQRPDLYLPLLEGRRVALFSNQTGIVGGSEIDTDTEGWDLIPFRQTAEDMASGAEPGEHILDVLIRQGIDVRAVFSPEHGFRGTEDAGANVEDSVDEKTGIPIISLYGSSSYPSGADLEVFDTLVVDIQDVGLRYYTYYITMINLMDACAASGKEVVILDRPNPNGFYVDGPILEDRFISGVGALPIPVVHGMTLGELAQMANGEGWLDAGLDACRLTVVPCNHYSHADKIPLAVRPSPNLKDMRAVYLYASMCYFEKTACSVGRGTQNPFEIYGSPYLDGAKNHSFTFVPESMSGALSPPFEGETCYGRDLREIPLEKIWSGQMNLEYLMEAYQVMQEMRPDISFFGSPDGSGNYWIDYLCGTDRVRLMIEEGRKQEEIRDSWREDVEQFKSERRPYLLYPET